MILWVYFLVSTCNHINHKQPWHKILHRIDLYQCILSDNKILGPKMNFVDTTTERLICYFEGVTKLAFFVALTLKAYILKHYWPFLSFFNLLISSIFFIYRDIHSKSQYVTVLACQGHLCNTLKMQHLLHSHLIMSNNIPQ